MSSSNDLNTMETLDDIENLLFLCDRLNNRLIQVTSYVDEVKQTWMGKRRSIELESNIPPVIAQKAIKCNKILLNVAEKLAVVELQTESLHNLHSLMSNALTVTNARPSPATQASASKTEPIGNGIRLQRDVTPTTITRSINNGTNAFTTRNSATFFSETVSVKTPTEQVKQSAFQRPLSLQDNLALNKAKIPPLLSQTPQNQVPAKLLSSGSSISHPTDSYAGKSNRMEFRLISVVFFIVAASMNDANGLENKIRVKMQVVPGGTIWRNADVPIVDHPSAFFVSNQDPRVAEQFNMMSVEMK